MQFCAAERKRVGDRHFQLFGATYRIHKYQALGLALELDSGDLSRLQFVTSHIREIKIDRLCFNLQTGSPRSLTLSSHIR